MSGRPTVPCSLCGSRVRLDRMLKHREQVHPASLSAEEHASLDAVRSKRQPIIPLPASPPKPAKGGPFLSHPDHQVVGEETEGVDVDLGEILARLATVASMAAASEEIPSELWERFESVFDRLVDYADECESGEREEQMRFEMTCRGRWSALAEPDRRLVEARERLRGADDETFVEDGVKGLEERQKAFAPFLSILREAGEKGVPHLAMVMMTDTWASLLAGDILVDMPSGPLRDRAIVEALFAEGDWVPDAGERGAFTIPPATRRQLFEGVTRTSCRDYLELQSGHWVALFEERLEWEEPGLPGPDFGWAVGLLHDLGHHAALAGGLRLLLDPSLSGEERTTAFLHDAGLSQALGVIAARTGGGRGA